MSVSNNIDDSETIKLLHSKICPNNKLGIFNNKGGDSIRKDQYYLQWTSEHMYNILVNK